MATKVLHGEGKPRIVIQTAANIHSDVVSSIENALTVICTTGGFTSNVLGRQLWSKNAADEDTWGKITGYDIANDKITVEEWSNFSPAATETVTVKNKIIDLPYCQNNLIETFLPDALSKKILYSTGKKIIKIKGFYYWITLDYSRYAEKELLAGVQDIYDASRTLPFYVYPRRDNYNVFYLCEIDIEKELQFAQHTRHQGHKLVVFNFEGVERITKPNLVNYFVRYVLNAQHTDYAYNANGDKIPYNP